MQWVGEKNNACYKSCCENEYRRKKRKTKKIVIAYDWEWYYIDGECGRSWQAENYRTEGGRSQKCFLKKIDGEEEDLFLVFSTPLHTFKVLIWRVLQLKKLLPLPATTSYVCPNVRCVFRQNNSSVHKIGHWKSSVFIF